MRLYLSSFRLGDRPDRLLGLLHGSSRATVVANALDPEPADVRRAGVEREVASLATLGISAEELDLRDLDADGIRDRLERVELVWARGGNVFALRDALARSGADEVLAEAIRSDRVVYGGYSAGCCVLAPSLRGLELVDDLTTVSEPLWDGLGILEHAFVPHCGSPGHPETAACDRLAERYRRDGVRHVALRDGQALVVDGELREIV